MKPSVDILRELSELRACEGERLAWLRGRLTTCSEELAREIESHIVEEPTEVGKQYNNALRMAAVIVRKAAAS